MVMAAIKLSFDYPTKDGAAKNATVGVPKQFNSITGSCQNETQWIGVETDSVNFTLTFLRVSGQFELSQMRFNVSTANLPDATGDVVQLNYVNQTLFVTSVDNSYLCARPQLFRINETAGTANITLSDIQLEAFHTKPGFGFSTARDCSAADTPDIVPIAVGIALAALVVIVLVAYLIARRHSQARGYMSM